MATITVIPKKDNAKNRRLAKQMAFWDRKRAEYAAKPKSRSVKEIFDSVFAPAKEERPVLTLKPTQYYPSGDNCCLPKVAIFSGVKTKQPKGDFGITVRA